MAPLAFGKSVFTKAAAAAAAGAEFGFVTGTHGDPNVSGHGSMRCRANAGSTKFSDSADVSIVIWFRALLGDFVGNEFGMVMQEAIPEPQQPVSPQGESPAPTQGQGMMTQPPSQ